MTVTWRAASLKLRGARIRVVEAKGTQAGLGLSEKHAPGENGARPSLSGMLTNLGKQMHAVREPILAVGPKSFVTSTRKLPSES